jgi:tetratricopeptide (TPR) repeat protein
MSRILVTAALLILSTAIVEAAYAQPTPSPTVSPQTGIAQQQERVQKQIKEEIEKGETIKNRINKEIKEGGEIRDLVQADVNRTFGFLTTLLNFQMVIVTAIPIAVAVVFWRLQVRTEEKILSVAGEAVEKRLDKNTLLRDIEQQLSEVQENLRKTKEELEQLKSDAQSKIKAYIEDVERSRDKSISTIEAAIPPLSGRLDIESISSSDSSVDWYAKGILLLGAKRFADALQAFQRAIELAEKALEAQPNSLDSLSDKGDALTILGDYPAALETFEKALKITNNNSDLLRKSDFLYKIARIHAAQNNVKLTADYLLEAIKIKPEYREEAKIDPAFDRVRENGLIRRILDES